MTALFATTVPGHAETAISCDDYRELKAATANRFVGLQVTQKAHNFWTTSKILAGAADCSIYHSDLGELHTYECNWRGLTAIAADELIASLKADALKCLEPTQTRERNASTRYKSNTAFALSSSSAFDVDAYVRQSASSAEDRIVNFEIARSDSQGNTGSGAGVRPPAEDPGSTINMAVSTLQIAAQKGDIAGVTQALAAGVNIDATGMTQQTALWNAAFNDQLATVQFLLKRGANVNVGGASGIPLQAAILGGHLQLAKVLLTSASMPTDARGPGVLTPLGPLLGQIVDTDDPELLKAFLARTINIDVNELNPITKWSALDGAIFAQRFGQAEVLVKNIHGWQFVEQDTSMETTLFNAVRSGSVEVTKAIIDNVPSLDLSHKNLIGQTVLDVAADNPAMLKVLLSHHSK